MSATMGKFRVALWIKFAAAFLLVALVGVAVVSLQANRATTAGFRHFLDEDSRQEWGELQAALADYYTRQGDWAGVDGLLAAAQPGRGQGSMGLVLIDQGGQIMAAAGGQRNRPATITDASQSLPIAVNGRQVATLLLGTPGAGENRAAEQFLTEVNRAIFSGGLVATLLALFLGIWLAHRLTRPLRQLTQATQQMATGSLGQHVNVNARDELGELANSFNQMSAALETAEQQRRQLLADVAHELRTPLSVMRSHIEAMLDGVFEMTPENLAVAHEETLLLGRLVEDLRTLSLAEAGQLPLDRTDVDLVNLVTLSVAAFAPLAEAEGVQLTADLPPDLPLVRADHNRIQQVLGNLLANALRHAATEKPAVQVKITAQSGGVQIHITDNGPGLTAEEQQHVFDRFWRADAARGRDQGGSGLGLAISRALVTAHHGRIWVESRPQQGATFVFALPLTSARSP
jgi:two-component system OmpR family sensor kinase